MTHHRSPRTSRQTAAIFRHCLVLLLPLLMGSGLWHFLSFQTRGGDSSGMTALSPHVRSSESSSLSAAEPATVPWVTRDTSHVGSVDSTSKTSEKRSLASMEGTYLPEVIAQSGWKVRRWENRIDDPIRVWIAPGDSVPGFRPSFVAAVREAFYSWEQSEVPVRFAFVESADSAEVRVEWADRLPEQRAGLVHWWRDTHGWLTKANIALAMRLSDGGPADQTSMHRMALHEIGHLLGLEHSLDGGDIMAAWVIANELSARDRATARLLYTLQPGVMALEAGALGS